MQIISLSAAAVLKRRILKRRGLKRILDKQVLLFLPRGLKQKALDELKDRGLIRETCVRPSSYVLTEEGQEFCVELWGRAGRSGSWKS